MHAPRPRESVLSHHQHALRPTPGRPKLPRPNKTIPYLPLPLLIFEVPPLGARLSRARSIPQQTYKAPNMASPVSIGDALLLAQIAWKLGRAFTKGRKSSISEFREVESQLFALGSALSALHDSGLAQNGDYSNALNSMLENCRATLSHLQGIVETYGKLGETRDDTEAPAFKRWSSRLQKDWKAIKWTTEGGDLANMRSQLMVHINTLNLIMSITSKCVHNSSPIYRTRQVTKTISL
jgi:hypothetical protein